MPCYDSRSNQTTTVYESGISPSEMEQVNKQNRLLTDNNKWLEAAICAIFNELDRRDVLGSVIAESSRNGLIGLMEFWSQHKQSDESRIAKALHAFSKDEQAVIKKLLTRQELNN